MRESAVGRVIEKLKEENEGGHSHHSHLETIEIIEAVILALVAVATAWSGYQAARWDGRRVELYSEANRLRLDAEVLATLAGQERISDNEGFDAWLEATPSPPTFSTNTLVRELLPDHRSCTVTNDGLLHHFHRVRIIHDEASGGKLMTKHSYLIALVVTRLFRDLCC